MRIDQPLATPFGRTVRSADLALFLDELKRPGFVQHALEVHHVEGAVVPS